MYMIEQEKRQDNLHKIEVVNRSVIETEFGEIYKSAVQYKDNKGDIKYVKNNDTLDIYSTGDYGLLHWGSVESRLRALKYAESVSKSNYWTTALSARGETHEEFIERASKILCDNLKTGKFTPGIQDGTFSETIKQRTFGKAYERAIKAGKKESKIDIEKDK